MRKPSLLLGILVGVLTSLPVTALLFLGEQFAGLPFVPFDFFDWLARVLPGDIIAIGTRNIVGLINALQLGDTSRNAKMIEQAMGLASFVGLGGALGGGLALALRRWRGSAATLGALAGAVTFALVLVVETSVGLGSNGAFALLWLLVLLVGWGALLSNWLAAGQLRALVGGVSVTDTGRRAALARLAGGSLAITLGAWGLGRVLGGQSASSGAGRALTNLGIPPTVPAGGATSRPTPAATAGATAEAPAAGATIPTAATAMPAAAEPEALAARIEPASGTRSELTSNEAFYRIDINTRPVVIQESEWTLQVDGFFANPGSFTLAELMALPAVTQPITIGCISNPVGGDLIGTSNWTGVPMRDLMDLWGLAPGVKALYIEGADGFFEWVVLEDLMDERSLLVYGMNGETLPVEHGFPLRIYIPNRYGMKQPKWITRIEAVMEWEPGYWVVRGWNQEARPQIVSVIDAISPEAAEDGTRPVGGIAWAGDRGIEKIEVQVDGGDWTEAQLRTPTLSPLTWVQWRYDWRATPGRHTLRVRATDSTGTLQTEAVQGVRPDGATGYHTRQVTV